MSNIITKTRAEQFALTLLAKNKKALREEEVAIELEAYKIALALTPKRILNIWEDKGLKGYLGAQQNVYFSVRLPYAEKPTKHMFHLPFNVPCFSGYSYPTIDVALNKYREKLASLISRSEALKEQENKHKKLHRELKAAIYELRSRKKILAEFPSLETEWPADSTNLPSNLSGLKAAILK